VKGPLGYGLSTSRAHWRLALILWLSLVLPAGMAVTALGPLTRLLDDSPFRGPLLQGWDSWAIFSWLSTRAAEWRGALLLVLLALAAGWLLQLFLTGGVLKVLSSDVRRPALARVIVGSVELFGVNAWATCRYLLSLAFWLGAVVGGGAWLLGKVAGKAAPPNSFWFEAREVWCLGAGLLAFFLVSLRFDLVRVVLARGEVSTARSAYRVAGARASGKRGRLLLLALSWTAVSLGLAALLTDVGVSLDPHTGAGVAGLVLFRQAGLVVQAMTRIAFWGTLLRFDALRRDDLAPIPFGPRTYEPPAAVPYAEA